MKVYTCFSCSGQKKLDLSVGARACTSSTASISKAEVRAARNKYSLLRPMSPRKCVSGFKSNLTLFSFTKDPTVLDLLMQLVCFRVVVAFWWLPSWVTIIPSPTPSANLSFSRVLFAQEKALPHSHIIENYYVRKLYVIFQKRAKGTQDEELNEPGPLEREWSLNHFTDTKLDLQ